MIGETDDLFTASDSASPELNPEEVKTAAAAGFGEPPVPHGHPPGAELTPGGPVAEAPEPEPEAAPEETEGEPDVGMAKWILSIESGGKVLDSVNRLRPNGCPKMGIDSVVSVGPGITISLQPKE